MAKKRAARKVAKKRPAPRPGLHRPRNDGQWTEPRFKAFIMTALRNARWGPKYRCIEAAFRRKGTNPATGKPCKLHECSKCHRLVPQKNIQADHIEPVIPPGGFVDWNTTIERMFVEKEGFQALCKDCHQLITNMERFGLDEAGAKAHREAVSFAKKSVSEQCKLLKALGAPDHCCVNARIRRQAFEQNLTHGNFPDPPQPKLPDHHHNPHPEESGMAGQESPARPETEEARG